MVNVDAVVEGINAALGVIGLVALAVMFVDVAHGTLMWVRSTLMTDQGRADEGYYDND